MAGYIGSKAVTLSTTAADVTGNATINGDLTVKGTTVTIDSAAAQEIRLGDNDKMTFGDATGGDLQIYHNGSHSYIDDAGGGVLILQTNGNNVSINSPGKNMGVFTKDAEVTLYYDNVAKLATTSTGIDVTGTVTADGLTVDGTATTRDDVATTSYYSTDVASNVVTHTSNGTGAFAQEVWRLNDGGTPSERMRLTTTGLGIGTSSPSQSVDTTGKVRIRDGGNTTIPSIQMGSTGVDGFALPATNTIGFITNSAERMRIGGGSDGAVMFGTTNTSPVSSNVVGISARGAYGELQVSTEGSTGAPLYLNRKTSDGDIAVFRKDGSTVGSIGNAGTNFIVEATSSSRTGLNFGGVITPRYNGSDSSSTVDFGSSSLKFKDAHFSGTVNATSFVGDGSGLSGVGGSTTYGAVGTYAFVQHTGSGGSGRLTENTTYSGSVLYPAGYSSGSNDSGFTMYSSRGSSTFSGTWRTMGRGNYYNYGGGTLALRIS